MSFVLTLEIVGSQATVPGGHRRKTSPAYPVVSGERSP
jgi:hypothetical protein